MKKMIFILTALLLAAPALADVTIGCAQVGDTYDVAITYVATEDGNLPRGLGLEITVDSGTVDLKAGSESDDYWVYPGSITIVDGEVTDEGTPVASGAGTSSLILEMGSLHYPPEVDGGNQPPLSGTLCTLTVTEDCNMTIAGNSERGNVVNYVAEPATANYTGCQIIVEPECYAGMADYAEWVAVGKPTCWCYPRQCHGDADGLAEGKSGYWVLTNDLTILSNAWSKTAAELANDEACADFDHAAEGKSGYRVLTNDLTILSNNWSSSTTPADCQPGNETP